MNLRISDQLCYNTRGVTTNTPEAQFQQEFYAVTKLLGDNIILSSE